MCVLRGRRMLLCLFMRLVGLMRGALRMLRLVRGQRRVLLRL
jgi:hypothetical protein